MEFDSLTMERSPHTRKLPVARAAMFSLVHLSVFFLIVLFATAKTVHSDAPSQRIICLSQASSSSHDRTFAAFQEARGPQSEAIALIYASINDAIDDSLLAQAHNTLVVAFGKHATEYALKHCATCNVFALAVPKLELDALSGSPSAAKRLSGIYAEQTLERQFRVIKSTLPTLRTLGVLLRPDQEPMHKRIQHTARGFGLQVRSHLFTGEEKPSSAIRQLATQSDAILATTNPGIYNKDTMFGILLTSFKSGVPIIGHASEHHDAGALLSIFASPEDMGRDLADLVKESGLESDTYNPVIRFSKYYHVTRNEHVAKSLGIEIEKEQ